MSLSASESHRSILYSLSGWILREEENIFCVMNGIEDICYWEYLEEGGGARHHILNQSSGLDHQLDFLPCFLCPGNPLMPWGYGEH